MATLQKQAENAALRKQIANDKLRTEKANAYRQHLNKNLAVTRKRKAGYSTPASPERDLNKSDRTKLIASARQLVEENPLALGLLRANVDFVVGSGYTLASQSKDKDFNKEIERRWKHKSKLLDARGLRSFGGIQRALQSRKIVDGDVFVVLSDMVEMIEADRCYKDHLDIADSGIDFSSTGRPEKYYFGERAPLNQSQQMVKPTAFEAENVVPFFNFPDERVERERGVSGFLQLMNLIRDIDENLSAMDMKSKNESFMGLIFKIDPADDGSIFSTGFSTKPSEDGVSRGHVKMVDGMNLNLEPGESVEALESKSPHENYIEYIRFRLRMAGLPFGMPLEFLMSDASDTNYSGLMMLAQMFRRAIKYQQSEMARISSRIYIWWLEREIKIMDNVPDDYMFHDWGKPSVGFIDPLKEAKAYTELLNAKLITRQSVLSQIGDGVDFEDLVDQMKKEQDYMDENEITYSLGDPGAPIANYDGPGSYEGQQNAKKTEDSSDESDD